MVQPEMEESGQISLRAFEREASAVTVVRKRGAHGFEYSQCNLP